jgi:hypothetical protein
VSFAAGFTRKKKVVLKKVLRPEPAVRIFLNNGSARNAVPARKILK